jgi:hypothetical protein
VLDKSVDVDWDRQDAKIYQLQSLNPFLVTKSSQIVKDEEELLCVAFHEVHHIVAIHRTGVGSEAVNHLIHRD